MKFHRRPMLLGLALVTSLTGFAIAATHAGASDPPVVLNPTSGPAGTTIKVTLPSPCKVPNNPSASGSVFLSWGPAVGNAGYASKSYPLAEGQSARKVTFLPPAKAARGHDTLQGYCMVMKPKTGLTFTPYGKAFFEVTGGKTPPPMNVAPGSGPPGTVVKVTAKCAPGAGQTTAVFSAALYSATDPNIEIFGQTSGAGPKQHTSLTVPVTFAPGAYFVAASCFDYSNAKTFAEQPFTVTAPKTKAVAGRGVVRR